LLLPKVHAPFGIECSEHFGENQPVFIPIQVRELLLRQGLLAFLIAVLGGASIAVAKDIAVVSNKSNSVNSLAMPELVKICKGQTNRWPDGKPITVITRDPGSPEMKVVLEKLYGMSKEEVAAAIAAANHGRANHPAIMVVSSDEDLVNKVESLPGAVGLVDVYSINGGVDVIKIGGKLPLEPGYPLHGN
jgi:ABC-type phosphate transport system substrate-binding protein